MKFFVEVIQYDNGEVLRSLACEDEAEVLSTRTQLEEQVDRRFYDVRVRVAD